MAKPADSGFTLLEVVIALAIIGIAMGAAIRASSYGADRAYALRERTLAGWVASNIANEILATRTFPEMSAREGKAQQGEYAFIWRQEVSATANLSFRRVEIKVFDAEHPDDQVFSQVTYVARVGTSNSSSSASSLTSSNQDKMILADSGPHSQPGSPGLAQVPGSGSFSNNNVSPQVTHATRPEN